MTQAQYIRRLLADYQSLPDTQGRVRPADRRLAQRLFADGVPLPLVRAALRVAVSRRRARPADATPLPPIRSLHYFLPVIEEASNLPQDYLDYICRRHHITADHHQAGCEPRI
ncbi:MAG: hypothetical protein ACRD2Z_07325 [Thermoanaerobaculia bacterium]